MSQDFAIHWFRRDLRVEGNALFLRQVKKFKGNVLGIFIFDPQFLVREDFSHKRFDFFLETLKILKKSLNQIGSDLLILELGPESGFEFLLKHGLKNKPLSVSFNRDYEPFARARDNKVQKLLSKYNVNVETERDHLIIEPHELLKEDGTFYKVFTPFSKKWKSLFLEKSFQDRIQYADWAPKVDQKLCAITWSNQLKTETQKTERIIDEYQKKCKKHHQLILPAAGYEAAMNTFNIFKPKISNYGSQRDYPAATGTSKCSIYFKNGSLTSAQVIKKLQLNVERLPLNYEKFLNEIIWREFYYHLIYHQPTVEHDVFQKKYANINGDKNVEFLNAWKNGETGFPIVDAGMRELNQTGWMHNRVRMIVASFLCKDLLISYKEGERYFMQHLLDGDLAPNNGGWQWAASTGCDAQPYFRIFNPWTQGLRFDENAEYIKKYIPELKDDSAKIIHNFKISRNVKYPKPIVEHDIQRALALKIYSQH